MKTRHELLGSLSEAADSCDKWGDSPSTSRSLLRLNETPGRRLAQGWHRPRHALRKAHTWVFVADRELRSRKVGLFWLHGPEGVSWRERPALLPPHDPPPRNAAPIGPRASFLII